MSRSTTYSTFTAVLDETGRVTIPAEVRSQLNLAPGIQILMRLTGDRLEVQRMDVEPKTVPPRSGRTSRVHVLTPRDGRTVTSQEVDAEIARLRDPARRRADESRD